jgi:hypothetical protein
MRCVLIALALAACVPLLSSCGGGGVPSSSISIYRVSPEVPISTSRVRGAITIHAGDDFQVLIKRLTSDDSGTHTSDVTTVCTYIFSQQNIATANALGVIHGVAQGFTTLEVKFQPTVLDSIDRCFLDITVQPQQQQTGGGGSAVPLITAVAPLIAAPGANVTFSATNTGGAVVTWAWNFGGGATPNTSTAASPTVVAGSKGSYNCSVTATNAAGSKTFTFTLTVGSGPSPTQPGQRPPSAGTRATAIDRCFLDITVQP